MKNVLIISGHPELSASHTNSLILEKVHHALPQTQIRALDTLYPNYQIDVAAEQTALLEADIVVLQFPFYWYSVPALLKKWIDDVFSYNFAYGSQGDKLKNKTVIFSFTIGGPAESYQASGYNHFEISEMIKPLVQTANLAQMILSKPIYSHGMIYIPNVYNTLKEVQDRAQTHANQLIERIEQLRQQ